MVITNNVTINLDRKDVAPLIDAVQGDTCSRNIAIALMLNEEEPWPIPEGVSVCVGYNKPDGTRGIYDTLPDGNPAWSIAGNVVTVAIAPQVLTADGEVKLAVSLMSGKAELSTFPVIIRVEALPGFGGVSEDYVAVGSLLPAVTEADNGKFLQVVNGAWAAADVAVAEEESV